MRVGERPQLPQKTSAASSVKLRAFTPSRANLVRSPPSYHSVSDARFSLLSHFDDFSAELEENIAAEVAETASQEGLNRRRRRRRRRGGRTRSNGKCSKKVAMMDKDLNGNWSNGKCPNWK